MDEPAPPPIAEGSDTDEQPPLIADLRQLAADGRTLIEAELAYQKSRAVLAGKTVTSVAGWGALALALVFFALMALVVGTILALTLSLGEWGAMTVVVAGLLAAAAVAGWIAARRWQRTAAQLADKDDSA